MDDATKHDGSPVVSEVDFAAEGRHQGFLRIPHSVHRSAYGWLPVPVISIRNGDGPKVVCMAGNHGDEYEGQVALTRLARSLVADDVRGQLILLPAANTPAAIAGLRTSPVDGGNLNRSFPGDPGGGPTQVIAHYLEHVLFEGADFLLDLHSGGSSLIYLPTALVKRGHSEPDNALRLGLVDALGLPFVLTFDSDEGGAFATSAIARQGGVGMTVELGGGGFVDRANLQLVEAGLRRYLRQVGVCPGLETKTEPRRHAPRILFADDDTQFVFARSSGLFEPLVELGDRVDKGQPAALIHWPEQPWREPEELCFEAEGIVICKRAIARSEAGDCLFQLGRDT
jgi:uncharacterized protein